MRSNDTYLRVRRMAVAYMETGNPDAAETLLTEYESVDAANGAELRKEIQEAYRQ